MKANKLFRKLALSGVALGAAAVTLTATTFAWYTANTEVKIGGVAGLTSANADTGSIYVSAATAYDTTTYRGTTWSTPGNEAQPIATGTMGNGTIEIAPVSYTSATAKGGNGTLGVYYPLSGAVTSTGTDKDTASYGEMSHQSILQYRLRLRTATAGTAKPVYLSSFTLGLTKSDGTTAISAKTDLPTVIGIAAAGGVGKDTAYGADLRKALKMTVDQYYKADTADTTIDPNDIDSDGYLKAAADSTVYKFDNYASVTDEGITAAEADALAYYNTVTGAKLSNPTTHKEQNDENPNYPTEVALKAPTTGTITQENALDSSTALKFVEVPATGYVEVVVTFWLDGWDEYCFDCMRKQGFTCSMEFTTEAGKARVAK